MSVQKLYVLLLVLFLGTGCGHVAHKGPIWSTDFARVQVPEAPEIPDDAPEPEILVEGREAPFTGMLLAPEELDALVTSAEQRDVVIEALDLAYRGRALDREEAEAIVAARELQLAEARKAQGRWFAVGMGAGIGATMAAVLAIVLAK
jgi:hypothetical protein